LADERAAEEVRGAESGGGGGFCASNLTFGVGRIAVRILFDGEGEFRNVVRVFLKYSDKSNVVVANFIEAPNVIASP
jgi:hypothetical protein